MLNEASTYVVDLQIWFVFMLNSLNITSLNDCSDYS